MYLSSEKKIEILFQKFLLCLLVCFTTSEQRLQFLVNANNNIPFQAELKQN